MQVTRIYNEQYAPLLPENPLIAPATGPGKHVMKKSHAVQQDELRASPLPWNETNPLQYWKVSLLFYLISVFVLTSSAF